MWKDGGVPCFVNYEENTFTHQIMDVLGDFKF